MYYVAVQLVISLSETQTISRGTDCAMEAKWLLATLLCATLLAHKCGAVAPATPFFCSLNELQCPSKIRQCIQSLELCNGIKDCADGSDENEEFCREYACDDTHPSSPVDLTPLGITSRALERIPKKYNRKCPSGNMCTKKAVGFVDRHGDAWLCTGGKEDCADGSDEDPRYCETLAQNCSLNAQGIYDAKLAIVADTCPSKKYCVSRNSLCDGKEDCPDGSDEWPSFCETYTCPYQYFMPKDYVPLRCKDWGCLSSEHQLCDGVKNCGDGSDEDPVFCANYSCPRSNGTKCSDGRTCVDESQLCDGIQTCPDGSDESASFCLTFECPGLKYKCKDGVQCVGYVDADESCRRTMQSPLCNDKSDAGNALCSSGSFSLAPYYYHPAFTCGIDNETACPSGVGNVRQGLLCDGNKDCADGSDEGDFCRTYNCRHSVHAIWGAVLCKDTLQCTPGAACNGWIDCKDKSDEDPAFCQTFDCPPGSQECKDFPYQCIKDGYVCDGTKQCINGGDEDQAFCAAVECHEGTQKCPNDPYQCIHEWYLCDGTKQCINGDDEDPAFCETFNCTAFMHKCPNYPYLCIDEFSLCDGEKRCPNGGDEDPEFCKTFKCRKGTIKCPNSPTYQCVSEWSLCDGRKDHSDGCDEDPEFCKTYTCSAHHWKCPNSSLCIDSSSMCDGHKHCLDGSDEDPTNCENVTKPEWTTVRATPAPKMEL